MENETITRIDAPVEEGHHDAGAASPGPPPRRPRRRVQILGGPLVVFVLLAVLVVVVSLLVRSSDDGGPPEQVAPLDDEATEDEAPEVEAPQPEEDAQEREEAPAPRPRTLVAEDFEGAEAGTPYDPEARFGAAMTWPDSPIEPSSKPRRGMWVERDPAGEDGNVLAVHYPEGEQYGIGGFNVAFPNQQTATLRYRIAFGPGFQFDRAGGKLPGLGGVPPGEGNDEPPMHCASSSRDAGFSARHMWGSRRGGAIAIYPYYEGGDDGCARRIYGRWRLEDAQWYDVEQVVRMNTPGRRDGSIVTSIDGEVYSRLDDVALSWSGEYGVNMLIFHLYFGGDDGDRAYQHSRDEVVYFDDIAIATPSPQGRDERDRS